MIDTSTDIQIKKNSVKKKIQIKKMIYTYTNKKKYIQCDIGLFIGLNLLQD